MSYVRQEQAARLIGVVRKFMRHLEIVMGFDAFRTEVYHSAQKVLSDIEHPHAPYYTGIPIMIPPLVSFGTSTWTYEGWKRQVYLKDYPKGTFIRDCLAEYCQFSYKGYPLFRTVGNDSSFYRPPTGPQLATYSEQMPTSFEMCFKVWQDITVPVFAQHPRYGMRAGKPNPRFLDAQIFNELVLTPFRQAKFYDQAGPFLFEFQRHGIPTEEFCSKLDSFFGHLPKEFKYAVEIRNPGLLGPAYRQVLERHGIAHVYNHWCSMPGLAEQHQRMRELFTAEFCVLRLLTPLNISYEEAKKRAEPYNRIVAELPDMRREAVDLIQRSITDVKRAYVLVNNRSEGNAPKTIQGLVEMLCDRDFPSTSRDTKTIE